MKFQPKMLRLAMETWPKTKVLQIAVDQRKVRIEASASPGALSAWQFAGATNEDLEARR